MKTLGFATQFVFAFLLSLSSAVAWAVDTGHPGESANDSHETTVQQLSREAVFALDLSERANQLSIQDRDPLKVCHSFGMLNSAMIYFANRVLNGPSSETRKGAIHEIMPLVAELNSFCRVPTNLAVWKPRVAVSENAPQTDIARRLRAIRAAVEQIGTGLPR